MLIKQLLYTLLPQHCLLCATKISRSICLCDDCENELPYIKHACLQCSMPLLDQTIHYCGQCLHQPPHFDRTISLLQYQTPVDYFVTQLKFQHKLYYARLLSDLFIKKLEAAPELFLPEVIIPVPLHKTRLRSRGFNQALEIAKPIAKRFAIPIDYLSCIRIKNTNEQTSTPARLRANNMKNAFKSKSLNYQHIAVIDDVITTGHTVNTLSKTLKNAGATTVSIWTIARTSLRISL